MIHYFYCSFILSTIIVASFGQYAANYRQSAYIPKGPGPVIGQQPVGDGVSPGSVVSPGTGIPQMGPGPVIPQYPYSQPSYPAGNPIPSSPISCGIPPCPTQVISITCTIPPCPAPAPAPIPEPVPVPEPAPIPACSLPPCPPPAPVPVAVPAPIPTCAIPPCQAPAPVPVAVPSPFPACGIPPCPQIYQPMPILQPSPVIIPQAPCSVPPCGVYERLVPSSYPYVFPRYTSFLQGTFGYGSKKEKTLTKKISEKEFN